MHIIILASYMQFCTLHIGNPPCNIQEECTTDVPPPHYARHRPHAVYETPAIDTGVPRPTPQGSGCGL